VENGLAILGKKMNRGVCLRAGHFWEDVEKRGGGGKGDKQMPIKLRGMARQGYSGGPQPFGVGRGNGGGGKGVGGELPFDSGHVDGLKVGGRTKKNLFGRRRVRRRGKELKHTVNP